MTQSLDWWQHLQIPVHWSPCLPWGAVENTYLPEKAKSSPTLLCSCEVDATNPGGDARTPRYNALHHNNDTSCLSDRLKLITCEGRWQQCCKAAKQHAFITPALRSTHAFVKSNLHAIPFVSPHVIDWNHITNQYQGHKLWFSLAVWTAKCHWRWWDEEGCSLRTDKHHPTYLLTTHEPLQILVNTKLVTPHDIQKAKTRLTSYRQFTKTIMPEQQIIWDAVEPNRGKKKRLHSQLCLGIQRANGASAMLHHIWQCIGARVDLQKHTVQISKRRYSPKSC